jgi:hypothetical protein
MTSNEGAAFFIPLIMVCFVYLMVIVCTDGAAAKPLVALAWKIKKAGRGR